MLPPSVAVTLVPAVVFLAGVGFLWFCCVDRCAVPEHHAIKTLKGVGFPMFFSRKSKTPRPGLRGSSRSMIRSVTSDRCHKRE